MLTLNLSEAEIQKLNYERFHYPSPIVQKRMHVMYMKSKGYSHNEISDVMDVHPNSVTNFIKLYNQSGLEGLQTLNYTGRESELEKFEDTIEAEFEKHPPLSSKQAADTIYKMTGISRCPTQIREFMKRIGMSFLKLGHIPAKANPKGQKKFLNTVLEPLIALAEKGKCHLLFMDAAHFVYAPFLCSLWCFFRKFIPAPSGRQRVNVLGAINAITKEINYMVNTTYINADTIVAFLEKINQYYWDKMPLYIVLDNARYQHCEYVKRIANQLEIELVFLPSYSPNLNIIERLWKLTKQKVLYAKYYDSFREFKNAILGFLQSTNKNKNIKSEINSLITLNFQLFEDSQNLAA